LIAPVTGSRRERVAALRRRQVPGRSAAANMDLIGAREVVASGQWVAGGPVASRAKGLPYRGAQADAPRRMNPAHRGQCGLPQSGQGFSFVRQKLLFLLLI